MKKINTKIINKSFIVLLSYIILTGIFNYSLLSGKNLMKWDIMDAYYPLCMSSADMLRNGRLPLWNAAFLLGTPVYNMLGVPYWYPTTLFFELTTGYSLICVALEYSIHIVLACFGMFLLAKEHLDSRESLNTYFIAAIVGGLYGFSGLFISNAQHIMIIISAAWLPYILFFTKKYFETKNHFFSLLAALCMGLSILGGYPEIWVATFIILIPYFLICSRKDNNIPVVKTAIQYIMFGIESAAASAISLIPFLAASKYVDRLSGGVLVNSSSMWILLSTILPHYTQYASNFGEALDISMISMYMGIILIPLLIVVIFIKVPNKWWYGGICIFSFLMMLGNNSFVHPIFQKYFPLFGSLRFPSLWRCILTAFALILAAEVLEYISKSEKFARVFSLVCLLGVAACFALGKALPHIADTIEDNIIEDFQLDLFRDAFIFGVYTCIFFIIIYFRKYKGKDVFYILCLAVLLDIFISQRVLYPVTVSTLNPWNLEQLEQSRDYVDEKYKADKNRTHSIDFKESRRTKSGLDSTSIVLGHTLDQEGYLSVQLNYVQKYRGNAHCEIAAEIPTVFITNDVVDVNDVNVDEWLQDSMVSPYQIYVDEKLNNIQHNELKSNIDIKHFISGDMDINVSMDDDGFLVVQQSYYPGWKVVVDGKKQEITKVNGALMGVYLEEGNHEVNFKFRPVDFYVGMLITVGYYFVVLICFIIFVRKGKKKE